MNKRQLAFVDEYVIDFNATQAAIRAGYSKKTAYSIGQRLLKKVEVQNQVEERRKQIQSEKISTAKDVEEFLSKTMRGELDEEVLLVVGAGEGTSEVVSHRKQVPMKERLKAAELLGKRYRIFSEKSEVDEEQLEKLDAILGAIGSEIGYEHTTVHKKYKRHLKKIQQIQQKKVV